MEVVSIGAGFANTYGSRGDGLIECHHNAPSHEEEEERVTKTSDLTLLCSNCHRMVHRKKNGSLLKNLDQRWIAKNSSEF